jgi:acyl-[acyl-carrier-protein]-phospholipid O-acyltransferase / long-chain-fatty-acid--[acyl-carrier-protein] ligase
MKSCIQKFVLWLIRGFVKILGRLFFQLHTHGRENIPSSGGALIVANHVSYIDFILILCTSPRHVSFVMNEDVFRKPILHFLFDAARCVPISPRSGKHDLDKFNHTVSQRINNGELVVIFAEGTVTRTGQLLEFKKGVEHISRLIHAPVIPIHFYNASGSPFSFKAGQSVMKKINWNNWRSPVWARIGSPLQAPLTAFGLRQCIKELEVENLQTYLTQSPEMSEMLVKSINKSNTGAWEVNNQKLPYRDLPAKLRSLDQLLGPALDKSECVAIMAPKSIDTMALMWWLMIRKITIVPIPDHFNNEEQLYCMNKSKAEWLITTRDLSFTGCAPIAKQIIYIEDLPSAEKEGKPIPVVYRQARKIQRSVLQFLRPELARNELAFVLFQKTNTRMVQCTALSHQNIWATILGIRQVYYFEKGTVQLSNIPQTNAHGIVMELLLPLLHDMNLHIARTQNSESDFLHQLTQCEPSLVMATPTQLEHLSSLAKRQNLPYLTQVFTADVNPQNEAIIGLRERGIDVFVCAGLNATSSVFAINLNDYNGTDIVGKTMRQENQNNESIGKALPGVAVSILDEAGTPCPADTKGWLWIKGPNVASMLHSNSECQYQLQNGWLHSGCSASIDHQGFIILHDSN